GVAGRRFVESFAPLPNQSYTFTWDGRDAYGRLIQGTQPIAADISYQYGAVYLTPARLAASFARFSGEGGARSAVLSPMRAAQEVAVHRSWQGTIGAWDARAEDLGGWSLDVQNALDPVGQTLYLGDGSQRSASSLETAFSKVINGVAGRDGSQGFS